MKKILLVSTLFSSLVTTAQLDARLLRFPDVSATQIAFVYGGDIWIVPKTGGAANRVPWAFQELNLGPIIGERTLGILVGPATGHQLIDGGFITVPDARLYGADGKWFAEGYGIKPDIEVWDDPAQLAKGVDPQLTRAVQEALKLVKERPRTLYPRPKFEDRSAKGLKEAFHP